MVSSLPAPVLAVTPDAVRDLEGGDALSRLWTVFTKCKESLQEGRRLENISWRLWYREMMTVAQELKLNPHAQRSQDNLLDGKWNEKESEQDYQYRPPTPEDGDNTPSSVGTLGPPKSDGAINQQAGATAASSAISHSSLQENSQQSSQLPDSHLLSSPRQPSLSSLSSPSLRDHQPSTLSPSLSPTPYHQHHSHQHYQQQPQTQTQRRMQPPPSPSASSLSPSSVSSRTRRNSSVGRIICDILPHRITPHHHRYSSATLSTTDTGVTTSAAGTVSLLCSSSLSTSSGSPPSSRSPSQASETRNSNCHLSAGSNSGLVGATLVSDLSGVTATAATTCGSAVSVGTTGLQMPPSPISPVVVIGNTGGHQPLTLASSTATTMMATSSATSASLTTTSTTTTTMTTSGSTGVLVNASASASATTAAATAAAMMSMAGQVQPIQMEEEEPIQVAAATAALLSNTMVVVEGYEYEGEDEDFEDDDDYVDPDVIGLGGDIGQSKRENHGEGAGNGEGEGEMMMSASAAQRQMQFIQHQYFGGGAAMARRLLIQQQLQQQQQQQQQLQMQLQQHQQQQQPQEYAALMTPSAADPMTTVLQPPIQPPALPQLQIQTTSLPPPPLVVVVNPTPNPTPHPTPPATPISVSIVQDGFQVVHGLGQALGRREFMLASVGRNALLTVPGVEDRDIYQYSQQSQVLESQQQQQHKYQMVKQPGLMVSTTTLNMGGGGGVVPPSPSPSQSSTLAASASASEEGDVGVGSSGIGAAGVSASLSSSSSRREGIVMGGEKGKGVKRAGSLGKIRGIAGGRKVKGRVGAGVRAKSNAKGKGRSMSLNSKLKAKEEEEEDEHEDDEHEEEEQVLVLPGIQGVSNQLVTSPTNTATHIGGADVEGEVDKENQMKAADDVKARVALAVASLVQRGDAMLSEDVPVVPTSPAASVPAAAAAASESGSSPLSPSSTVKTSVPSQPTLKRAETTGAVASARRTVASSSAGISRNRSLARVNSVHARATAKSRSGSRSVRGEKEKEKGHRRRGSYQEEEVEDMEDDEVVPTERQEQHLALAGVVGAGLLGMGIGGLAMTRTEGTVSATRPPSVNTMSTTSTVTATKTITDANSGSNVTADANVTHARKSSVSSQRGRSVGGGGSRSSLTRKASSKSALGGLRLGMSEIVNQAVATAVAAEKSNAAAGGSGLGQPNFKIGSHSEGSRSAGDRSSEAVDDGTSHAKAKGGIKANRSSSSIRLAAKSRSKSGLSLAAKGKGKVKSSGGISALAKNASSTTKLPPVVDPSALPSPQKLIEQLLPQKIKTIMLTESEYETETDDEDDAEWSSEVSGEQQHGRGGRAGGGLARTSGSAGGRGRRTGSSSRAAESTFTNDKSRERSRVGSSGHRRRGSQHSASAKQASAPKPHQQQQAMSKKEKEQQVQAMLQQQFQQQQLQRQQVIANAKRGHDATLRRTNTELNTTKVAAQLHQLAQLQQFQDQKQVAYNIHGPQRKGGLSVEQAAMEAQRQLDMFAKLPIDEVQANVARTRSVGLLSQLMKPDPRLFDPSHPYRRGFSSADVQNSGSTAASGSGTGTGTKPANDVKDAAKATVSAEPTKTNVVSAPVANVTAKEAAPQPQPQPQPNPQPTQPQQPSRHPSTRQSSRVRNPSHLRHSSSGYSTPRAPAFSFAKAAVAEPVASVISADNAHKHTLPKGPQAPAPSNLGSGATTQGRYRPKGRPEGMELEDDSESEGEGNSAATGLLMSQSVAQEKLRRLAEKSAAKGKGRSDKGKEREEIPTPASADSSATAVAPISTERLDAINEQNPPVSGAEMNGDRSGQPIPPHHPYNLPLVAMPLSPRSTRLVMVRDEMSESLRWNVIWERKSVWPLPLRRTASHGAGEAGKSDRPKPLTALPSLVQLAPKQPPGPEDPVKQEAERRQEEAERLSALRMPAGSVGDFHLRGW